MVRVIEAYPCRPNSGKIILVSLAAAKMGISIPMVGLDAINVPIAEMRAVVL
jgi:hypothetical protein